MTLEEYNDFCQSLPHAAHVVQWGGAHVWKVGGLEKGKVFAIGGWPDKDSDDPSVLRKLLRVLDHRTHQPNIPFRGIPDLNEASVVSHTVEDC